MEMTQIDNWNMFITDTTNRHGTAVRAGANKHAKQNLIAVWYSGLDVTINSGQNPGTYTVSETHMFTPIPTHTCFY